MFIPIYVYNIFSHIAYSKHIYAYIYILIYAYRNVLFIDILHLVILTILIKNEYNSLHRLPWRYH